MKLKFRFLLKAILLFLLCSFSVFVTAQKGENVSIKTTKITDAIFMLEGINGFGGGNVIVSIGKDGILLVDNMYDWMTPKILQALEGLTEKSVEIVINTHYHTDHIGGNKNFKPFAKIYGHENIQKRTAEESWPTEPITNDTVLNFNNERVHLSHYPTSHTDGDLVVYFEQSHVLHLGDMYFNGMFPAIYKSGGGDLYGLILSIDKIVNSIPPDTKIVPGHGEIASVQDLTFYLTMLRKTTKIVSDEIQKGSTLDELIERNVLAEYDKLGEGGAQTTDQYLKMLFDLISDSQ